MPGGTDFEQAVLCFFEILIAGLTGGEATKICKRVGTLASFLYGEDDASVELSQGCLGALFSLVDPGTLPAGKKLRARQFCSMRFGNPLASLYSLDKVHVMRSTIETL